MIRLLRSELTRALARPLHRLVIAVSGGLGLLFVLVQGLEIATHATASDQTRDLLAWPNCLAHTYVMARFFAPFVVSVLAASVLAHDYAFDTWKMILPRRANRWSVLLAKLAVAYALGALAIAALFALTLGPGALVDALTHLTPVDASLPPELSWGNLAFLAIQLAFFVALAGGTAIATRSPLGGMSVGVGWHLLSLMIHGKSTLGAWVLPDMHLDNLRALFTSDGTLLEQVQMAFEAEVKARTSLLVLGGYLVVLIGGAMWLLARRDQASSTGG